MPQYKRAKPFDIVQEILDLQRLVKSIRINNNVSQLYTYTPTWTAATTNPSLGNGTLVGQYRRVGRHVFGTINFTAGSTTTFGTGSWSFGLPFPASNNWSYVVRAMARDTPAGSTYISLGFINPGATSFVLQMGQAVGGWTSTQPFTWGSGDNGAIQFDYESDT